MAWWRLNPAPRPNEFSNNGGGLAVPNGTNLHTRGKGQIGFAQNLGGVQDRAATLGFAITDRGYLQFLSSFADDGPCSGALYPTERCVGVDVGIHFKIYLGGEIDPLVEDTVLPDDIAAIDGVEDATAETTSYLFLGGPAPVAPGRAGKGLPCGPDRAGSPKDLGCASYTK